MDYEQTWQNLRRLAVIIILTGFRVSDICFGIENPQFTLNKKRLSKIAVWREDVRWKFYYNNGSGGTEVSI